MGNSSDQSGDTGSRGSAPRRAVFRPDELPLNSDLTTGEMGATADARERPSPITSPVALSSSIASDPAPPGVPPPPPSPPPVAASPRPVLPLNYVRAGSLPARPGSLITIGVIGLLIGGLSIVGNVLVGMLWWNAGIGSLPPPPPPPPGPLAPSTVAPYTGEIVAPRGIARADRVAIIDAFHLEGPVRADLAAMLERLLAECGKDMFPPGVTPTVTSYTPGGITYNGPRDPLGRSWMFDLPTGRVTIAVNRAEFAGPSGETVVNERTARSTTTPISAYTSSFAIDQTIAELHSANPTLTDAQLGFIADKLPAVTATYDNPRYGYGASMPVEIGTLTADGVLTISIGNTDYYVLRDGRHTPTASCPARINGVTGVPYQVPATYTPSWPGAPALMFAQAGHCGLNLLVALVLMFGSFRVIAKNPQGVVMLLRWIVLKFALMAMEIVLVVAYVFSIDHYPPAAKPFDVSRGLGSMALSVVLQSILPLVTLGVCKGTGVREWLILSGATVRLIDRERWSSAIAWLRTSRWVRLPRIAGILLGMIAALNGLTTLTASLGGSVLNATLHLVVAAIAAVSAIRLRRLRPRVSVSNTTYVLLITLVLLKCSSPARAQSEPAHVRADPPPATSFDVERYYRNQASHGGGDSLTGPLGYRVVKSPEYANNPAVRAAVQKILAANANERGSASVMLVEMFDAGTPDEQWVAAQVLSSHVYINNNRPHGPAMVAKLQEITGKPVEWTDSAGNYRANIRTPNMIAIPAPAAKPPPDNSAAGTDWAKTAWWATGVLSAIALLLVSIAFIAAFREMDAKPAS
ncbi:hypothetical protein BH10PLA1_BH10PLA1_07680 [soil metagenome]